MPFMNVIPPGLDFSNLKVDLPEDPVIKEMLQHKPAYGGVTPKAADSPKSSGETPKKAQRNMGESSEFPCLCSGCFVEYPGRMCWMGRKSALLPASGVAAFKADVSLRLPCCPATDP